MSKLEDEGLKALLDPKSLLEQLRACETKQFTNAIDLLEQCEERHRRNEKKLSRLTIAASAGGALVGQEAVKEVGEITGIIEQVVSGDVSAIGDAAEGLGFDPSQLGLQVGPNGEIVLPGGMMGSFGGVGAGGSGTGMGVNAEKAVNSNNDESDTEEEEKGDPRKDFLRLTRPRRIPAPPGASVQVISRNVQHHQKISELREQLEGGLSGD